MIQKCKSLINFWLLWLLGPLFDPHQDTVFSLHLPLMSSALIQYKAASTLMLYLSQMTHSLLLCQVHCYPGERNTVWRKTLLGGGHGWNPWILCRCGFWKRAQRKLLGDQPLLLVHEAYGHFSQVQAAPGPSMVTLHRSVSFMQQPVYSIREKFFPVLKQLVYLWQLRPTLS